MKFFGVIDQDLKLVESVMKRLFTEQRMTADEMRDAAQKLEAFLRTTRNTELPDPYAEKGATC